FKLLSTQTQFNARRKQVVEDDDANTGRSQICAHQRWRRTTVVTGERGWPA
ncbi:hypothetical protein A2U01_0076898, partial [Trifolium medium]|nr:hypothetical protein [Trifolium medium]